MEIENQVCSLELAKRLKELGVEQNSLFYWLNRGGGFQIQYTETLTDCAYDDEKNGTRKDWAMNYMKKFGDENYFSAFTVAELGETMKDKGMGITAHSGLENGGWWIRGGEWIVEKQQYNHLETGKSWVDTLAKMLVYLIENNLLK